METNDKEQAQEQEQNKPNSNHSSQGHKTDAKGTVTNTQESTLRSATTDSTRAPKKNTDENATGGNVR